MLNDSLIKTTAQHSPLSSVSHLNPEQGAGKKELVAAVILTSLVDAFSILVIYLLVNFSNSGEILYISKDMELPTASKSEVLKRTTLVKLEKGKIYLEEKEVTVRELVRDLIDIRKKLAQSGQEEELALTVQADRRDKYKHLNQIVHASSQAGFSDIKFAVLAD